MGKYGMSETDKVREILKEYCVGDGLDIGYGGSAILPTAITVDMPLPYTNFNDDFQHLHGNGRDLYWFQNGVLDYVYSSALLEDFPMVETLSVIKEWLRVLKSGGNLVLYLPNEKAYKSHCETTGQSYNEGHQNHDLDLGWFKDNIIAYLDVDIIHENPISGDYMFEIVLRKH